MKPLKEMAPLDRQRCRKCDYLNNDIPISKKKPRCIGSDNLLNCEIYMKTGQLETRIDYLTGKSGPMFMCSREHGCYVDDFNE